MTDPETIQVGDKILFSVELLNDLPRDGAGPIINGIVNPNCRIARVKRITEYTGLKEILLEVIEP